MVWTFQAVQLLLQFHQTQLHCWLLPIIHTTSMFCITSFIATSTWITERCAMWYICNFVHCINWKQRRLAQSNATNTMLSTLRTGSTANSILCTCEPLFWLVGPIKDYKYNATYATNTMLHVQHDQLQPVSFAIMYLRFHWSAQSIVPLVPLHLRTPSLCFDWSAQSNAGRKESNGWDESNAWVEGQSWKTDVMMTGVGW